MPCGAIDICHTVWNTLPEVVRRAFGFDRRRRVASLRYGCCSISILLSIVKDLICRYQRRGSSSSIKQEESLYSAQWCPGKDQRQTRSEKKIMDGSRQNWSGCSFFFFSIWLVDVQSVGCYWANFEVNRASLPVPRLFEVYAGWNVIWEFTARPVTRMSRQLVSRWCRGAVSAV